MSDVFSDACSGGSSMPVVLHFRFLCRPTSSFSNIYHVEDAKTICFLFFLGFCSSRFISKPFLLSWILCNDHCSCFVDVYESVAVCLVVLWWPWYACEPDVPGVSWCGIVPFLLFRVDYHSFCHVELLPVVQLINCLTTLIGEWHVTSWLRYSNLSTVRVVSLKIYF